MAWKRRYHWQLASCAMLGLASIAMAGCAGGPARQTSAHSACAADAAACPGIDGRTTTGSVSSLSAVSVAPEVLAAEARRRAVSQEIERARATARPDASFIASLGTEAERSEDDSRLRSGGTYSYALSLDMPLYQGGRPRAALEAATADLRASEYVVADRRIATAYELSISLLRIRQQRDLTDALKRQRATLVTLRQELGAELAAGFASQVDIDDTDRQIARIDVLRETAQLAISEASRTTNRLGVSDSAALPDLSALGLGEDRQALIDIALSNNPRIRENDARVDAAAARIAHARGEMLPTVSARLQALGEDSGLPGVEQAHGGRAEVRLAVPFNLNGAAAATVRQRSDEKLAAQMDSDASRGGVMAAVRSAFDRRVQARRMLVLSQSELKSAKSMLSGIRAERRVGERSTFDEIRAIEDVTTAETNLNTAKFELQAAEYTLAAETGLLGQLFEQPIRSAELVTK